jgi:PAS domain S-box-containing protein
MKSTDINTREKNMEFTNEIEEALRISEVAFETSDAIMITDADANIIRVNQAFLDTSGYSQQEVIGKNPRIMSSGMHDKAFYADMWQQLLQNGYWSGEIFDKRKNGEIYPKWTKITAVKETRKKYAIWLSMTHSPNCQTGICFSTASPLH